MSAGVDLLVAVKITGEVLQNSYFKEVLEKTEGIVEKGQPLSTVFEKEEKPAEEEPEHPDAEAHQDKFNVGNNDHAAALFLRLRRFLQQLKFHNCSHPV